MSYAIIGSGAIGSALASQFARKNIRVAIANRRGPESLAAFVGELGPEITAVTTQDAVKADVVILAVPFKEIPCAVRDAGEWKGRIVVDASNAIDFPSFTPTDLGGRLSSEVVSDLVPGARLVKAFNTLPAAVLAAAPTEDGGRRVVFLSGNDADANGAVARLVERLGFSSISLGKLAEGGRTQHFGGPLMVQNLIKKG